MKKKILNIYYCSNCETKTSHSVKEHKWEENKNITQFILQCDICENPTVSWVHLKENINGE